MQHLQEYEPTDQEYVAADAIKLSMSHLPSDHSETQIRRGLIRSGVAWLYLIHGNPALLEFVEQSILRNLDPFLIFNAAQRRPEKHERHGPLTAVGLEDVCGWLDDVMGLRATTMIRDVSFLIR